MTVRTDRLALILLLCLSSTPAIAQRLTISRVDTTGYPVLKALVYALDADGRPIPGLSAGDLKLSENGTERRIIEIDCPSPGSFKAISSVLTIDVSGSMSQSPEGSRAAPNIALARAAANAWIAGLPPGESECAVTTFDDAGLINQDFTSDRSKLSAAIQALKPQGGTNYDAGLLADPAGAIRIASEGRNRRVIVFLTDGRGNGNEEEIVRAASAIDATIYCVTLGMPAPDILKNIARRTGGECYENVTTVEEAEGIYRAILYQAGGGRPCEITWRDEAGCAADRRLEISIPSRRLISTLNYIAPSSLIARLDISPAAISFGRSITGRAERPVKLTAINRPITVRSITPSERGTSFSLDGGSTPFTLQPGESRTVTVGYSPGDGRFAFNRWKIESDACSGSMIFASAGSGAQRESPIHLKAPDGGETFRAGELATITWEGISARDTVKIEYSTDNGTSWKMVTPRAGGLSYKWLVPATPSTKCLARVTTLGEGPGASGTGTVRVPGLSDFSTTADGSRLVSIIRSSTPANADTIAIWSLPDGRRITSFPFNERGIREPVAAGSRMPLKTVLFSPDGERIIATTMNNETYGFDAGGSVAWEFNGQLLNDLIQDLDPAVSHFSPDGSRVVLAVNGESRLVLADVATGKAVSTIPISDGQVYAVEVTNDGREILATRSKKAAQILNTETGGTIRSFPGLGGVKIARASLDGSTVVTVSGDWKGDTLRAWNRTSGTLIREIPVEGNPMISPDGTQVVMWPKGIPTLVDIASGTVVQKLVDPSFPPTEKARWEHAKFSPNGTTVVTYGVDRVTIWDALSGTMIKDITANTANISRLRFSLDGSTVIWNRGWNLEIARVDRPATIQEDRSDRVWSIVADTKPAGRDVDFGQRITGSSNDSVVAAYIRNDGSGTMTVSDIRIEGANAGDFSLVSGIPPFDIPAGGSRAVELRFAPSATGARVASVRIDAGGRELTQSVRGTGVSPQLRLETGTVDFQKVLVGTTRDTAIPILLRNTGSTPVTISRSGLIGPDSGQFVLTSGGGSFTLAPGEARAIAIRFAPTAVGRTSTRLSFAHNGVGPALLAEIYGDGVSLDDDERYVDPTTFRTIASPNAVIPEKGTIVAGSYDVVGVMAGYAITDNVMILAGGGIPLPDDWGGVKGNMYGAYSIGVKAGIGITDELDIAAGFQWGRSMYDQESTPDQTESVITVNAPYAAISYGDDDSRISATFGYAWKRHVITTGEFDRDAGIIAIGGDYRIGNRWKIAVEGLSMKTLGFIPIAVTARYFSHAWALDIGGAFLGIGDAPEFPVAPVVSFVHVW